MILHSCSKCVECGCVLYLCCNLKHKLCVLSIRLEEMVETKNITRFKKK